MRTGNINIVVNRVGSLSMRTSSFDVLVEGNLQRKALDMKKTIIYLFMLGLPAVEIAQRLDITIDQVYAVEEEVQSETINTIPIDNLSKYYTVNATVYNATENQTDRTPLITTDGTDLYGKDIEQLRILAVSADMLRRNGGVFDFGDAVYVEGTGKYDGVWYIHDVMNYRYTKSIDFLVLKGVSLGKWSGVKIYPLGLKFELEV